MSVNQLKAATNIQKEPKSFPELLERMKPEIARALPKHLNADRMSRIALTEFRKNPKLGECNLQTVFGSIITLSQLGLEPGVLGQAYLIPYGKDCQAVPGWQGYADLVARGGRASVWTGAVYDGDHFDYALGDRPFITHRPDESGALQKVDTLTHVYAVGRIKGAEWPVIEVWSVAKVKAHRDRFNKVGNRHYSFQHFEMYGRKVALLQVIKYMPKSVEVQSAVDLDSAAETGTPIDMKSALDGSWVAAAGENGGQDADADATQGDESEFDVESGIKAIRAAKDLKSLDVTYKEIIGHCKDHGISLPVDIEAARNERKEAIEQAEKS